VTSLAVSASSLADTFAQLRDCGAGRRECVVYWCADHRLPARVARVVHPKHASTRFGYEVDSGWVTAFFLDLRERRQLVRAQVHTHPGLASHSEIDDQFALAPATGFLSLVIPNFATGPVTLDVAHLVVIDGAGTWREMSPGDGLTCD
jgi:hypothetical protein